MAGLGAVRRIQDNGGQQEALGEQGRVLKLAIIAYAVLTVALPANLLHADGAPKPVGVNRNPAWVRKPTSDDITAVWPHDALASGLKGQATLSCGVNIQGLAEGCRVTSEQPPGQGFGAAVLALTTQFLFHPATRDGVAVPSQVTVPIRFDAVSPTLSEDLIQVALLSRPPWASAPTFAETGSVYPKSGEGKAGYVVFRCHVKADGGLQYCAQINEIPAAYGFGGAAHGLLKYFRVDMAGVKAPGSEKLLVDIPIRLIDPQSDEFTNRRIGEPIWLVRIDPEKSGVSIPPEARKAGVRSGLGRATCVVNADGLLTDCIPGIASPPGLGFSEEAVSVVSVMRMNRWTNAGGPIDGAKLTIPVRLAGPDPAPEKY